MPRAPREPPSPSALVPALLRYLGARGRDPAALAARLGLPADAADRDEIDATPAAIGDLLAAAAALLDDPYLALRLPAELPLRRYGLAELAARAAPTLRESLHQLARYGALVHPQLALSLAEDGDLAAWHQATPAHPRGISRHAHEYGLAYVLTHARAALAPPPGSSSAALAPAPGSSSAALAPAPGSSGAAALAPGAAEPLPLHRVWFAHARPRDLAPLDRFFGTEELAFGAEDSGFSFARAHLDRPLATGDARLFATAAELAQSALREQPRSLALAPRVAAHVRARLPEAPSADEVAAALQLSARTLQRRLEAEGTSLTAVADETRAEVARELLADPELPLGEIAYRAGFADLATFSRAFKRWTGTSPGRYRRGLVNPAGA
jgi:AraC-like DNA-binding protein